jgi:putative acetyltransferase
MSAAFRGLSVATIRPEQPDDRTAIHAVHAASFPTSLEARLVDALRDAGRLRISLVATVDGEIVGHLAFSPVALTGADDGLGLAPLAVLPGSQKRGIAAELIRAGLGACQQAGAGFVVVLGEPGYYSRFGFVAASHWRLHDEYGGGDAFQALELRASSIPPVGGIVRYAPEFTALEESA